jgi:alpha-L-rhamnosidase
MHDRRRGAKQTAYRILVAGTPEKLATDEGDLWDSGKVVSDQSTHIVYAGKPLQSRMRCHWKVRLWDADGAQTSYSDPALWTMGLLKREDVKAEWIGLDRVMTYPGLPAFLSPTFEGCGWIWTTEPNVNAREKAPQGTRFFRRSIALPHGRVVRRAAFLIGADDGFELFINGKFVGLSGGGNSPMIFDVTNHLTGGRNCLAASATNDAPSPAALAGKLVIEYDNGETRVYPVDKSWKFAVEAPPNWTAVDFDDSRWPNAGEIAKMGDAPWGIPNICPSTRPLACPLLRKEFHLRGAIRRATVYASALGNYRLHINGRPVAKDYFTPDWTDYNKRVYYNTYDVTELLRSNGPNAIGAVLAAGWYSGGIGWGGEHFRYGDKPRFMAQLEIELTDGTRETVTTDASWRVAFGPYVEGEFLAGETYDATREIAGWDQPGLNDRDWERVAVTPSIPAGLHAFPGVTVQETSILRPVKVTEPSPGAYVYDLGQNFAGFARLHVRGPTGTRVVLRYAEALDADGMLYTKNLRSARATDTYILKGDGEETWQPRFTYHGFRYVEVTGYPGKPGKDAITGIAIHSNIPLVGTFECSSPMVNRLYQNIVWTQRANFISVPTDCPQRDERLGWSGDAETFVRAATYNADVAAFFTKWLVDFEDGQAPDGAFPDVAPFVAGQKGIPAWADAGTICPWTIYNVYNDKRLLAKHYQAMAKWVDHCCKNSNNLLRPAKGYGDWLSINADTPLDVVATAYFAHTTRLTADAARALEKNDDARMYDELLRQIKQAFNAAYVGPDGRIKGDTQTCYLMALAFDLLPNRLREKAIMHLVADIKSHNNHLSTGFVGTSLLMPTLSATGNTPLAYRLLLNDTFPSWGFSIKHGATSIWERWDGWTSEAGFQSPVSNSLAHYSFGAVGQWLFQTVAGIDTLEPGFHRILIRPQPAEGLTWVKAGYHSLHGKITSEWKIESGKLTLTVTIPANTMATVYLPVADSAAVSEGARSAASAQGVKFLRTEGGESLFEVGAGEYLFSIRQESKGSRAE